MTQKQYEGILSSFNQAKKCNTDTCFMSEANAKALSEALETDSSEYMSLVTGIEIIPIPEERIEVITGDKDGFIVCNRDQLMNYPFKVHP